MADTEDQNISPDGPTVESTDGPTVESTDDAGFGASPVRRAESKRALTDVRSYRYERDGTASDAVGLIPLLRGAFKVNEIDTTSLLTTPFIRMFSPEIDLRTHSWNIQNTKVLSRVYGDMEECGISFYSLLERDNGVYGTPATEATHTPKPILFVQVLDALNSFNTEILAALEKHKAPIADNSALVRTFFKRNFKSNLESLGNATDKATLRNDTYHSAKTLWDSKTKGLINMKFVNYKELRGIESWSGLSNFDAFSVDASDTYGETVKKQELGALDTIISCLKLELDYYKTLSTVMKEHDFAETLLSDLILKKLHRDSITKDAITDGVKRNWQQFLGSFFKDILTERLEILQAHLLTFFKAVIGNGPKALTYATHYMEVIIYASISPVFAACELIPTDTRPTSKELADFNERANCKNFYSVFSYLYGQKITLFFRNLTVDGAESSSTKNLFTMVGLDGSKTISTETKRRIEFDSIAETVRSRWVNDFPSGVFADHHKRERKSAVFLSHRPHEGREHLQVLINEKIADSIGTNSKAPIARILSRRIVHGNGLIDNAFAAVLCSTPSDKAAVYLHSKNYPIVAPLHAADTGTANNLLLQAPSTATLKDLADSVQYNKALDARFKIQIKIPKGLTRPASAKADTPRAAPNTRPKSAPAGGRRGAAPAAAGGQKKANQGAAAPAAAGGQKKANQGAATPRGGGGGGQQQAAATPRRRRNNKK